MWDLIVLAPDHCLSFSFTMTKVKQKGAAIFHNEIVNFWKSDQAFRMPPFKVPPINSQHLIMWLYSICSLLQIIVKQHVVKYHP